MYNSIGALFYVIIYYMLFYIFDFYHEIGHALVAAKQTESAPVHKITIIPRTSGALGYTMQVDEKEHFLMSKEEL